MIWDVSPGLRPEIIDSITRITEFLGPKEFALSEIKLKVINADGHTMATTTATEYAILVNTREYQSGDRIVIETSEPGLYCVIQLDEATLPALVQIKEREASFYIPFGEKTIPYSPKAFSGDRHLITARVATEDEVLGLRNLALNPYDSHENSEMFPHASANVETRGEAVFAARNAVDGIFANSSHGEYPYQSWGINRQADAALTVDLGVPCRMERIGLTLRADFPHDNYWVQATLGFSDGREQIVHLEKTPLPQYFEVDCVTESVTLRELIKSSEPSPFPALTQIEVWGRVAAE